MPCGVSLDNGDGGAGGKSPLVLACPCCAEQAPFANVGQWVRHMQRHAGQPGEEMMI